MAIGSRGAIARQVERLYNEGTLAGLDEFGLLDRFRSRNDEEAFAALVVRHGPMVLATCRRVLRDSHDADDAFQATFLLLARKSGTIRGRSGLASWLHRVAVRVALRSHRQKARRRIREVVDSGITSRAVSPPTHDLDPDVPATIHEELARLPESHRLAVIACDLEGLTHEEAAARLRWPVGSVKGRLARGRDQLRDRLTRRGLATPVVLIAATLSRDARAAVPPALMRSTIRAATDFAAGKTVAGMVPVSAIHLAKGAAIEMTITRLGAVGLVTLSMLGVAAGLHAAIGDGPAANGTTSAAIDDPSPDAGPPPGRQSADEPPHRLTTKERRNLALEILGAEDEIEQVQMMLDETGALGLGYMTSLREVEVALILPGDEVWFQERSIPREDAEQLRATLQSNLSRLQQSRQDYRGVLASNRLKILDLQSRLEAPDAEPRKLKPGDRLQVDVLEAATGRPIKGERTVRQDGTISLGFYGDLFVAGLDRYEIKEKLISHLLPTLSDEQLGTEGLDADGNVISIAPRKSDRVSVQDVPVPDGTIPDVEQRLADLERRLDEALGELKRLRGRRP